MPALNIKNEEVVRLVKELADLEGESMTTVVMEAVKDRLKQKRGPRISDEVIQYWTDYGKRIREAADPEWLARDPIEDLYDEKTGLPK